MEEGPLEDAAIQTPPPKPPDIRKTLVPKTAIDPSCLIYTKPRQTHLSLLPPGTVCVQRCLPTWVGKPVHVQQKSWWEPNEQLHGVQLSQEEKGESEGVEVESEEGRIKPAFVFLPPACPFYMKPPSQEYTSNSILLPAFRAFYTSAEESFQPSLDFDTHVPFSVYEGRK